MPMPGPTRALSSAQCIGAAAVLSFLLSACTARSHQAEASQLHAPSGMGRGRSSQHESVELIGSRREFATGACVEFAPIGTNRHRVVFIDPGHGGADPGATAPAANGALVAEKSLTLRIALDLRRKLRQHGYEVVLSRIHDGPVGRLHPGSLSKGLYTVNGIRTDLEARIDCANASHAQLLLSIHFDAFGDPTVGGTQTDYDPDRPSSRHSLRFATLVQQAVATSLAARGWSVPDRGVIPDTQLDAPTLSAQGAAYGHLHELGPAAPGWIDRPSRMPGALVEPLFISDPAEASLATSGAGQNALSGALVRAIEEYF